MPRFEQWVPFFERSSSRRDAASWWKALLEGLAGFGAKVKLLVSDRASALIKLGKKEYLNAFSMPDLFHFMQDISRAVGSKLSLQLDKAIKQSKEAGLSERDKASIVEIKEEKLENCKTYDTHKRSINTIVHPFNEADQLSIPEEVEKGLQHAFTKIRQVGKEAGIDISLEKGNKILKQIPDIAGGIGAWQEWLREEVEALNLEQHQQNWLITQVLPYAYWQVHLGKVSGRKRDKELRIYYKERAKKAMLNFEQAPLTNQLEEAQKELYVNWAFQMAATFHRASSQVEGRNGYLSFFHRAHRGIRPQRQEALTVVHNFDIHRADGKTPAQRLFKRDFPPLFDFILDNVTRLPSPRKRKRKPL